MKIRRGFVSNSSSSSFICDISGNMECGYDMSAEDAEMYECEKGHTFMDQYVLGTYEEREEFYISPEGARYNEDEERYDLPSRFCPVCQFKEIISDEAVMYLMKKCNINMNELKEEIRDKFIDYDAFKGGIK